jgi:predicted DsbA family dithiol-disulfide isomerase
MEKSCYQELITEISNKLTSKILSEEKDIAQRAVLIDQAIAELLREVGLETVQKVLENTRDEMVTKKRGKV